NESLFVKVRAKGEHDGIKNRRILPWLTTVSDRGNTLFLELVEKRYKFIPVGRLFAASFVEGCLVDPHPVGGMNVYRRCNPVAVIFGKFLQRCRDNLVPAFFASNLIKIAESALLRPVADIEAEHLHCSWSIACRNASTQNRHGF